MPGWWLKFLPCEHVIVIYDLLIYHPDELNYIQGDVSSMEKKLSDIGGVQKTRSHKKCKSVISKEIYLVTVAVLTPFPRL